MPQVLLSNINSSVFFKLSTQYKVAISMMNNINKGIIGGMLFAFLITGNVQAAEKIAPGAATPVKKQQPAKKPSRITSAPPAINAQCPLNSGGPSLAGSKWRLKTIYNHGAPAGLDITLLVGQSSLVGFAGCNNYTAAFRRVGLTGFKVTNIYKTKKACAVKRLYKSGPTINVGNWEGSYLRVIKRMGSVQRQANQLNFYDRNGKIAMVFVPGK